MSLILQPAQAVSAPCYLQGQGEALTETSSGNSHFLFFFLMGGKSELGGEGHREQEPLFSETNVNTRIQIKLYVLLKNTFCCWKSVMQPGIIYSNW